MDGLRVVQADERCRPMITAPHVSSPIATDVAIGRVVRAAVKARAGVARTSVEQGAARELHKVLVQQQKAAKASFAIPENFVPDDTVRAMLQQDLAATLSNRPEAPTSSEQMVRLLATLEALGRGEDIDRNAADELLGFLHRAGRPTESSAQPVSTSLIDGP